MTELAGAALICALMLVAWLVEPPSHVTLIARFPAATPEACSEAEMPPEGSTGMLKKIQLRLALTEPVSSEEREPQSLTGVPVMLFQHTMSLIIQGDSPLAGLPLSAIFGDPGSFAQAMPTIVRDINVPRSRHMFSSHCLRFRQRSLALILN